MKRIIVTATEIKAYEYDCLSMEFESLETALDLLDILSKGKPVNKERMRFRLVYEIEKSEPQDSGNGSD